MNIDSTLSGRDPTLDEFAEFVWICERLSYETIWNIISEYPKMHFMLMGVARDQLVQKISAKNSERFDETVVKPFNEKFGKSK